MATEPESEATIFHRLNTRLAAKEDEEEEHDASLESGAEVPVARVGVRAVLGRIPSPVWAIFGLLGGMYLGAVFPVLSPIGEGVKTSLGYLGDAVPMIIFFTLTPALVTMFKTSSAGRFALYVVVGFTLTTAVGGLFALLLSLAFFPDMTLGFGAQGLGAILGDLGGRTLELATTSRPFKAIWGALFASIVLYFGGGMKHDKVKGVFRNMLRTIADIYELIGVHGVAAIGRGLKLVMPVILFTLGIYLARTVPEALDGLRAETVGLADPPYSPATAYFLTVGVIAVITLLWLAFVSFGVARYCRFPVRRIFWQYLAVVYPFAWVTASSAASIPINLESARKGLGIRANIRDFVLPLGATVNLDGTMMAAVVTTIVAGKMVGYTPSVVDLLIALIPLILITVGTPGVPGGLALVAAPILADLLPLVPGTEAVFTGIFVALGIGLNDQFRTAVNVADNGFLALILDKWWPERFAPGAEPNPFMRTDDEVGVSVGTAVDKGPFWTENQ